MSTALAERVAPAWSWVPEHDHTWGGEVADLSASCGFAPDADQRLVLDAMFAERRGRWAALESAVVCPRQNLKTAVLEMAVLGDLFLMDARLVVWTAHRVQTALEAFRDFVQLIDANEHLSRRVRRITEASGNQGIELANGARLKFLARSKSSGRGLTGDVVVLDEAFALSDAEMGALLPTLSARPNPAVRYGSSAGLIDSEVLRAIRDRGRAGGDPSLAWIEWASTADCERDTCSHEVGEPGCVLDDPAQWAAANPALGRRIAESFIAAERRALPPAEFARERLGWWDEPTAGRVIPGPRWAACGGAGAIVGPVCVFADVAMDRAQSVLAVAGHDEHGVIQVELAEMASGTEWLPDRVASMIAAHEVLAVGARSAGPVASLLPELRGVCDDAQTEFVKVGTGDFAGMCGGIYDLVASGGLRHRNDPRLDAALTAARRHQVVDAWTWERSRVDVDAAPLVAATGAVALFAQRARATYDVLDSIF